MLALSRKEQESICVGDSVVITIGRVSSGRVVLLIDAPRELAVHRSEVYLRLRQECEALAGIEPASP